jgi:hypothetical protein
MYKVIIERLGFPIKLMTDGRAVPLILRIIFETLAKNAEACAATLAKEMSSQPVVLYDGVCNLCNAWVRFIIGAIRQAFSGSPRSSHRSAKR